MKNILIIGGGLAALYFATQNKKGGVASTPGTNLNDNGNSALSPVVVGGGATPGNKTFDIQITAVDTSYTGIKKNILSGKEQFQFTAKAKITNTSNQTLELKEIDMVSPYRFATHTIDVGRFYGDARIFNPGQAKEFRLNEVFAANATVEKILESIEFKVTI